MNTGDKRTIPLILSDIGWFNDATFIFIEGIGYVSDHNVSTGDSYDHLDTCGYVTGVEIERGQIADDGVSPHGGERFICRLLTSTEWDDCIAYDDSDETWHWKNIYSWVRSLEREHAKSPYRVIRGSYTPLTMDDRGADTSNVDIGFRPVLVPLTDTPNTFNTADLAVTVERADDNPEKPGDIVVNLSITIPQSCRFSEVAK